MTFLLLRQSSDLTLAILRAAFSRRHKKRAQSPDSHSTEGLTALTRMLAERRAPNGAPNASTHSSQRNGQDSVEHMQRINAKDDAVGGGEVRLRPRASSRQASSQPIAPAVAGQAPPQPVGKSIAYSAAVEETQSAINKTIETLKLIEVPPPKTHLGIVASLVDIGLGLHHNLCTWAKSASFSGLHESLSSPVVRFFSATARQSGPASAASAFIFSPQCGLYDTSNAGRSAACAAEC